MAHEQMFDTDDPILQKLREVCLVLPDSEEFVSHGRPTFRAGKVFAVYGTYGAPSGVILCIDPEDRSALEADERFFVPKYYPDRLALDLNRADWLEVAELVEASYRQIATKRRLAALDVLKSSGSD